MRSKWSSEKQTGESESNKEEGQGTPERRNTMIKAQSLKSMKGAKESDFHIKRTQYRGW